MRRFRERERYINRGGVVVVVTQREDDEEVRNSCGSYPGLSNGKLTNV